MKLIAQSTLRGWSIFWTFFIGVGAIVGMLMFFTDPTGAMWGMAPLLVKLQRLPLADIFFKDFVPSGIVLFLVNGASQLGSAALLLFHSKYASFAVFCCGIILVLWCLFELLVFGVNVPSALYLIFGVLEAATAFLLVSYEIREGRGPCGESTRRQAADCVEANVLKEMRRQFEECGRSLDEQYRKYGHTDYFRAEIVKPGSEYIIGYPKCFCPMVASGLVIDPAHCECSRQSIIYVLHDLLPDSKITVKTIETVLSGGDECRFRVVVSPSRLV